MKRDIFMQHSRVHDSLNKKISVDFGETVRKTVQEVEATDISELETAEKIKFAYKLIIYLIVYWKTPDSILKAGESLTEDEKIAWEGLRLAQFRQMFRAIFEILLTLPEKIITNYEALLLPYKKFTRKTFEYFAALMKVQVQTREYFPFVSNSKYSEQIHKYFKNEFNEREKIVEAALESTIIDNINEIKDFLLFLHKHHEELSVELPDAELLKKYEKRFRFPGIYALTKRVIDTNSLHELSLLTIQSESNIHSKEKVHIPFVDTRESYVIKPNDTNFTNKRKFALLRTLQRIGELLTGKHLQNKVSKLDNSVYWDMFIVIRDTISHQEIPDNNSYYDNYHKIQNFLENQQLLFLVELELSILHLSILNLISLRYENTRAIINNRQQSEDEYKKFWRVVLDEELDEENKYSTLEENMEVFPIDELLDAGEIERFKSGLKSNLNTKQLKYVDDVIYKDLNLNGKKKGEFFSDYFIDKNKNAELRKQCINIYDKISKEKAKYKREQYDENRQDKLQEAAEQKKLQDGNMMVFLRDLTCSFRAPSKNKDSNGDYFSLEISISHLNELNALFKSLNGELGSPEHKKEFNETLVSDREFKYAVEYCISQALSMINVAKEKISEVGSCKYFAEYGKEFRRLRNWIEHGNAILDFFDENFPHIPTINLNNKEIMLDFKDEINYTIMVHVLINLLPQLNQVMLDIHTNVKNNNQTIDKNKIEYKSKSLSQSNSATFFKISSGSSQMQSENNDENPSDLECEKFEEAFSKNESSTHSMRNH